MFSLEETQYAELLHQLLIGEVDPSEVIVVNNWLAVHQGDKLDLRIRCASMVGARVLLDLLTHDMCKMGRC